MGKLLTANFSEDNVSVILGSFLTAVTFPHNPFSIEMLSRQKERFLGADARLHGNITGFLPFYMQFKRPCAYPAASSSKIITDRTALGASISPRALFFSLREKKPKHHNFQHNVLFRLRSRLQARGLGEVAYICPLFLDRSAYQSAAHASALSYWPGWNGTPWYHGSVAVRTSGGAMNFNGIPLLTEHVTIPPHATVTTAKHHYSFSEQGDELCFHEPTALPEGTASFAEFLNRSGNRFLERGQIEPNGSDEILLDLINSAYGDDRDIRSDDLGDTVFSRWSEFGHRLQHDFGIAQFAFVQWRS